MSQESPGFSHGECQTVGDRVIAARDVATKTGKIHIGDEGTVCVAIGTTIGVAWDRNVGGHDLYCKLCEKGYGWYMTPHDIQPSCSVAYEAPSTSELSALLSIPG